VVCALEHLMYFGDYGQEALAIKIDIGLPSERVVRVLERIITWRDYPMKLRMDNGPELISATLAEWAKESNVEIELILSGKQIQILNWEIQQNIQGRNIKHVCIQSAQ